MTIDIDAITRAAAEAKAKVGDIQLQAYHEGGREIMQYLHQENAQRERLAEQEIANG